MKSTHLAELIREASSTSKSLSNYDRESLRQFVEALESCGDARLDSLIPKIRKQKKAPTKKKATNANIQSTVTHLRKLYDEVRTWPSPEFEEARKFALDACRGLTGPKLREVSQELLGSKNSNMKVNELRLALAEPALETLRTRFMNSGA